MLVCFLIGLTHILWLIPRERFFYTQEKLLTIKRRKGRKLSMIYPEAFALASPKEAPTEPGFCIDHAYIAGESFQDEEFGVGVTFPNHPGARFEFRSSTGSELNSLLSESTASCRTCSLRLLESRIEKGEASCREPSRRGSIWLREAIRDSAPTHSCGRFKARRNR
ncbi:T6SS immunity protein Tli4 family protein [Pseudomonas aeruginosa]